MQASEALCNPGLFLQSRMFGALAQGLATCAQAALNQYPYVVAQHIQVPEAHRLVCGMALGYADVNHPINQYRTTRDPVQDFSDFYDQ